MSKCGRERIDAFFDGGIRRRGGVYGRILDGYLGWSLGYLLIQ